MNGETANPRRAMTKSAVPTERPTTGPDENGFPLEERQTFEPEPSERVRPPFDVEIPLVDDPGFHEWDAEAVVIEAERSAREHVPGDSDDGGKGLPGHLRALCAHRLLSPAEERALFLRMNYERRCARALRERWRNGDTSPATRHGFTSALAAAERARERIVLSNTRLVVALARKFVVPGLTFDDLLAAGFLPLMRAVDLFDVSRGFRFSTYATWAVRNHLLRVRKQRHADQSRFRTGEDSVIRKHLDEAEPDDAPPDASDNRRVGDLLRSLDDRERTIVEARFGLNGHHRGRTFKEIGELVGLSKERVRQLVHRALERMGQSSVSSPFEIPGPLKGASRIPSTP